MAYDEDISGLGADHLWKFDNSLADNIGSNTLTSTTIAYNNTTPGPLCKDATYSGTFNARADVATAATSSDINNSAMARKAVCGWFRVDSVQLPFCVIYMEGDRANEQFLIALTPGNYVTVEVRDAGNWQVQVYSTAALKADRTYHLAVIFEGSGYGDEVRFYIDGIEQTLGDPTDRAPGAATLGTRNEVATFGDPVASTGFNGTGLVMQSTGDNRSTEQIINSYMNHWATWGDEADAVLTETEVRETLFERGALADHTVETAVLATMQTDLDGYSPAAGGVDTPCAVEIEAVSGGGDFTLELDGQEFHDDASIHVRYNGTSGTCTVVNTGGSNATIGADPFGGTLVLADRVDVTITVTDVTTGSAIENARVLLKTDPGGTTIIDKVLTNASGQVTTTYDLTVGTTQAVEGTVRKGSTSTAYKTGSIAASITSAGLDLAVQLVPDE